MKRMNQERARWLGLTRLIGDAVEHGSIAVERIHMSTARRPFEIIESIPPLAAPTQLVHQVHDTIVSATYSQIRFWNAALQKVVQVALELGASEPGEDHLSDPQPPNTGEEA